MRQGSKKNSRLWMAGGCTSAQSITTKGFNKIIVTFPIS